MTSYVNLSLFLYYLFLLLVSDYCQQHIDIKIFDFNQCEIRKDSAVRDVKFAVPGFQKPC
jgi:hypothetical protein